MFYQDDTLPNIGGRGGETPVIKATYVLITAALSDGHAAGENSGPCDHKGQWAAYLIKRWLK